MRPCSAPLMLSSRSAATRFARSSPPLSVPNNGKNRALAPSACATIRLTMRCIDSMARQSIPRIIEDQLIPPEGASQSFLAIQVGSDTWYTWLNEPATRSFAFHSPQGALTARREQRHGTWYWYAYRTQDGHLHKVYLGKSEELTLVRLHEAAALLSADSAKSPRPTGTLSSPRLPVSTP